MDIGELRERHKNLQYSEMDARTAGNLRKNSGCVTIKVTDFRGDMVESRNISGEMANKIASMFDESAILYLNKALD